MKFTGCSLIATAAHPQALVDAVRLALVLLLPFNHHSCSNSGGETDQREEEPEELQPRAGHRIRITAEREDRNQLKKKSPSAWSETEPKKI